MFYLRWTFKRVVNMIDIFWRLMFGISGHLVTIDKGGPNERYRDNLLPSWLEDYKVYLPRMARHLGHLVRLLNSRHLTGLGVQREREHEGHPAIPSLEQLLAGLGV